MKQHDCCLTNVDAFILSQHTSENLNTRRWMIQTIRSIVIN